MKKKKGEEEEEEEEEERYENYLCMDGYDFVWISMDFLTFVWLLVCSIFRV